MSDASVHTTRLIVNKYQENAEVLLVLDKDISTLKKLFYLTHFVAL